VLEVPQRLAMQATVQYDAEFFPAHRANEALSAGAATNLDRTCVGVCVFLVERLPRKYRQLLRWRMSQLTPIVVKLCIARAGFRSTASKSGWIYLHVSVSQIGIS